MIILHIITSLKVGGAERALCNMLEKLREKGYQHHVAYFHLGPCVQTLTSLGIKTYQIKGLISRYDVVTLTRLYKLVKTLQPNVIHTSLWAATLFGRLIGKRLNIPVVTDQHGNCADEGTLRNILDRQTAHLSNRIIAVSSSVETSFKQTIIGAVKNQSLKESLIKRLMVIRNGINPELVREQANKNIATRTEFGIPNNAFVIGAVGRLEPIKSYDVLIRAFGLMLSNQNPSQRPLVLCLVGDGSQRKALETLAAKLNIKQAIIFAGTQTNPYRYYPLFNCFALSSNSEGLSIALLEALCFGLPIVTTHSNMQHDVIAHGINGLLVQPQAPQKLADALETLYANPGLEQAIRQANAHLIDEQLHINRVAEQYNRIFLETTKLSCL